MEDNQNKSTCFVEIIDVSVDLGRLNNVSVHFEDKKLTVLMGNNGAGKSTVLSLLAGIIKADVGAVHYNRQLTAREVGYLPEPAVFYDHLTVKEHLAFQAGRFGLLPMNIKQASDMWQLDQVANKKTSTLSLGYRQRLALAQVWMQRPRLLLFDEPMNGMDPELMQLFQSQLRQWKSQCCVIMASHMLDQIDDLADAWVVMAAGEVLASGPCDRKMSLYWYYQQSIKNNLR